MSQGQQSRTRFHLGCSAYSFFFSFFKSPSPLNADNVEQVQECNRCYKHTHAKSLAGPERCAHVPVFMMNFVPWLCISFPSYCPAAHGFKDSQSHTHTHISLIFASHYKTLKETEATDLLPESFRHFLSR